jgi:RNA polymerase sigma factor (sigma-70 family)
MNEGELAVRFSAERQRLTSIAYRVLGSAADAEDAVQNTWLRLQRAPSDEIENLPGWLTTSVARASLDLLRARKESPAGDDVPQLPDDAADPEEAAVQAESVSRALLVVLDRLSPAERVAFVLHDLFAVPFDQIAPVVGRTVGSAKKLASRARHKVRRPASVSRVDLARHREVVEAFLAAARGRNLAGLLAVLAPEVVRVASPASLPDGEAPVLHGAEAVARETSLLAARAAYADLALVGGDVGLVVAWGGRLRLALTVTVRGDRIAAYEVISDADRLAGLEIGLLAPPDAASARPAPGARRG